MIKAEGCRGSRCGKCNFSVEVFWVAQTEYMTWFTNQAMDKK